MRSVRWRVVAGTALGLALASPAVAEDVNIYSTRQDYLVMPALERFTRETGIKVNIVFMEQGLTEKLRLEGRNSPADLLLTADIARLAEAKEAGVTQPITDPAFVQAVPAQLRDPDGHWFGVTTRARVLYVAKDRVKPGEITRYEDLADPKWRGRVCTRSGAHDYQVALLSAMIAHLGEAPAKAWLAGLKANLARKPQGNDRAQAKAIMDGVCDVALGNTYYYGLMLENPAEAAWARAISIVFPNQADRGTHLNLSGIAMTAAAAHKEAALKLARYLVSAEAQQIYASKNYEYPILESVEWSPVLRSLGEFRADPISLERIGKLRPAAIKLTNETGYDG